MDALLVEERGTNSLLTREFFSGVQRSRGAFFCTGKRSNFCSGAQGGSQAFSSWGTGGSSTIIPKDTILILTFPKSFAIGAPRSVPADQLCVRVPHQCPTETKA